MRFVASGQRSARRQGSLVHVDAVRPGRETREVVAAGPSGRHRREDRAGAGAGAGMQSNRDAIEPELGAVLDAVTVRVVPHQIADRSESLVAEVGGGVVLGGSEDHGQGFVGGGQAGAGGEGRLVHVDAVGSRREGGERVDAAGVGGLGLHDGTENGNTGSRSQAHVDARQAGLAGVLRAVTVLVVPDEVADRAGRAAPAAALAVQVKADLVEGEAVGAGGGGRLEVVFLPEA